MLKLIVCLALLAGMFVHQSNAATCYVCASGSVSILGLGFNADAVSCKQPVKGTTPTISCTSGCSKTTGGGSLGSVGADGITRGCGDLCVASSTTFCCNGDYCNSVNGLKFSFPLLIGAFVASVLFFRR